MIEIDAREMEHPLPLEVTVEGFRNLKDSEVIHLIHRREPLPLFEIISKNGGFYHSYQSDDEAWHILITRDCHINLEHFRV
ncbi:MAG: DUF2249 domain-containing protein [Sulfuricurvum sp.]|nr:DUF2249 domain-containing protein [Sulfuricurvum sp.]MDD5386897.1 DUF2249 domain-containing protein [Sulfuricurvum sp.]